MPRTLTLPAFAKINLDLRVLGTRADGYHDLRTIFQSLALHDDLTFTGRKGAFAIECDDPQLPTDRRNLIWKAASLLWRTVGRRSGDMPRDAVVRLVKRVPKEAGLGGGSADAAATLIGLTRLWKLDVDAPTISRLAARLGADVPFFLVGGTALGLGRGDDIYPLTDLPRSYVVIVHPHFGVPTADAFGWYDADAKQLPRRQRESTRRVIPDGWPEWSFNLRNDLEPVVATRYPAIHRIRAALTDAGAVYAALSGSGSAVFGVFDRADAARRTAVDLGWSGHGRRRSATGRGWDVYLTRTLSKAEYGRKLPPTQIRRPRASGR